MSIKELKNYLIFSFISKALGFPFTVWRLITPTPNPDNRHLFPLRDRKPLQ